IVYDVNNGKPMILEGTAKYLKIKKSTLYKMAREDKISAVKIELGRNNKIIIRILYNQDLINY
ncbi:helix-turn-helix domain-containing protein, partial [Peptococcaceae bacterium]|nr:helix-turn-helix domain-containing protein [Peptococcaceae bacterium]